MLKRFILKTELFVATTSLLGWIGIGTVLFHRLEPWTWIQSFYFCVVTITTVGFGDLTPSSEISRLFTAIYILVGVSVGLVTLSLLGSEILKYGERRHTQRVEKRNQAAGESEES
ncbi:MAG: potassium channel family protein [Bacteroidota bacterium]